MISRTLLGKKKDRGDDNSGVTAQNASRSSIDIILESCRELGVRQVPVSGRTVCVWALVSTVVSGLHLSLFVPAFRESWYAPVHFLWVVVCACGVSLWCLRPGAPRRIALVQTVVFLVVSCGLSWAVVRVPWGSGIAREASGIAQEGRLPLSGALLVFASFSLVVVSVFLVRRAGRFSGSQAGSQEAISRERG